MNAFHAARTATKDVSRASRRILRVPKTDGRSRGVSSFAAAGFSSSSGWAAGILRKASANDEHASNTPALLSAGSAKSPEEPRRSAIAPQGRVGGQTTTATGSSEHTARALPRQRVDTTASSSMNRERGWDAPQAGWMADRSKIPGSARDGQGIAVAAGSEGRRVHGSSGMARQDNGAGRGRSRMVRGQWQPGTRRARGNGGSWSRSDANPKRRDAAETDRSSYERGDKQFEHERRVFRQEDSRFGGNRVGHSKRFEETERFKVGTRLSSIRTGGEVGYAQAVIMRLLKQAKSGRDCAEAKRVLEEGLKRDDAAAVVDVFVYSAAMGVFSKAGEWETALEILRGMKERGVRANEFVYNQAITACGNGGQWKWAVYLLKVMDAVDGVSADVVSYNAAISACGRGGQSELAVVLLREMQEEKDVAPNATSYGAAISACKKADQSHLVDDLHQEMQRKGLTLQTQPGDGRIEERLT